MSWFTFALIAAVGFAGYSILVRIFLKDGGDAQIFALLSDLAVAVVMLALLPFDRLFVALGLRDVGLIVVASGLYAASSLLFFWGRQLEEVSKVSLVRQLVTIWIFLGGVLVLGEPFSIAKGLGVLLIIGGAVLAVWEGSGFGLSRGLGLVLAGTLTASTSSLIGKTIVEETLSPTLYLGLISALAALWLFIGLPNRIERIAKEWRFHWSRVLIVGGVLGVTVFLLFKAYQIGQASRVGPVYGFSLVLSVLGGILLLGEREHVRLKVAVRRYRPSSG